MQTSRIFTPDRACLDTGIPNGSTEYFEMIFFGCMTNNAALECFLVSGYLVWCQKSYKWT